MKPVVVPTTDVNSETAVITAWRVADRTNIEPGTVVAQVETSKAVVDVLADNGGYLLREAREGEEIRLARPIAYVFPTHEALEECVAQRAEAASATATAPDHVRATTPARRRAEELGVDLASFDGRALVTVKLVEAAAGEGPTQVPAELPLPLEAPAGVERVALIGAGLGATQVIEILAGETTQQPVAIVDDDTSRWADEVAGVPVVGGTRQLAEHFADGRFDAAVISISTSVPARTRLRELCGDLGIPLTNAIDSSARIAADVRFGVGNVVCAFCHFGEATRVGDNNFLSAYNSYDHHNVLGSDISTGPGCMTSGLVTIGDRVRLGTGIFIEPHVHLGDGVQVASGAVIVGSVPPDHAVKRRVVTTTVVPLGRSPRPSTDDQEVDVSIRDGELR